MENVAEGNSRALHLYETHPMTCHLVLLVPCRCQMAHSNCRPLGSIDTKWRAMVWEGICTLFPSMLSVLALAGCRTIYKSTKHCISVAVN